MPKIGKPFTLAEWLVKPGRESEFVAVWESFAQWTSQSQEGTGTGHLLQDSTNTRRFVSFGPWENLETIDRWRSETEFQEFLGKMRDLCEDVQPRTLKLVSLIPLPE